TFNQQFSSTESSDAIFFGSLTYALFLTFLIVMTIVIMNLLVGLAVDDIKGVQNQASVKRLAMQIQLILDIESILPHWLRKRFNTTHVTLVHGRNIKRASSKLSRWLSRLRKNLGDELGPLQAGTNEEVEETHNIRSTLESVNDRIVQIESKQDTMLAVLNRLTSILEHEQDGTSAVTLSSRQPNGSFRADESERRQRSSSILRLR
ncbi:hypothetical protein X801_07797, partial [Opisthorchis viverrini]